ncbi:MAG: plastocyanin/azurin family copper-binding protein, partial [Nitrospinota bacterium]
ALAADPTSGRTVTVDMVDIEFRPARIRLDPGDRIRFINKDPFGHSVFIVNAADPNMVVVPDTKVAGNASYTTEPIDRKGVFILYCTIHGGMKGLVSTTGSFKITGK